MWAPATSVANGFCESCRETIKSVTHDVRPGVVRSCIGGSLPASGPAPRPTRQAHRRTAGQRTVCEPAPRGWGQPCRWPLCQQREANHRTASIIFAELANDQAPFDHSGDLMRSAAAIPPQCDTEILGPQLPVRGLRQRHHDRIVSRGHAFLTGQLEMERPLQLSPHISVGLPNPRFPFSEPGLRREATRTGTPTHGWPRSPKATGMWSATTPRCSFTATR